MHILQLGPYPPPRGGVWTNMEAIQDKLLENGHRSSVISITKSESLRDEENVYHPRSSFDLLKLIFSLKYDVLHLHIGGGLPLRVQFLILFCGLFTRGKAVLTFHSGGYPISEEGRSVGYWTFRGFIFRRFDQIIVVNSAMREMFEKFGINGRKIQLIYPFSLSEPKSGVDVPKKFENFWKRLDRVLITSGLFESDYDLPLQINALADVVEKYPRTGLVVLGSGSLREDVEELILTKHYRANILLAGDTDRDVVLHLIERADLMLRTTIFDGDAISVREALFLGTPVIATDNGMRPDGVRLIPVGDGDALEKAIEQEFENQEKPAPAGEDGSDNIRKILSLYENLLKQGDSKFVSKKKTSFQSENKV